jgi:hypothetical protein
MGFDANQFRAQQVQPGVNNSNLTNVMLASLLGLGVLAVGYMYFHNIKQKNASSEAVHSARMADNSADSSADNRAGNSGGLLRASSSAKAKPKTPRPLATVMPKPQNATSPQLNYAVKIEAEIVKYRETTNVLRSCGKRAEYASKYYNQTNNKAYWKLIKIRDNLPKIKTPKGEPIVPDAMVKSWGRLGKIENEKDVAMFLLKGGAIKHQMAAMEMMSNMSKMDQQFRQEKKDRASARTKEACMALARKVQQAKLNVRIPKKPRRS